MAAHDARNPLEVHELPLMRTLSNLCITLVVLSTSVASFAQSSSADRDMARKHAGCANAYAELLARTRDNKDQTARMTAEKMKLLHERATTALVGESDAARLMKSTRASLELTLAAIDATTASDPQAVEKFFGRRIDTCTQNINDLTEEQKARIENISRP